MVANERRGWQADNHQPIDGCTGSRVCQQPGGFAQIHPQGCKVCEGTAEAYVSTAAEYSDKGLFYTVDFGEGKEFVKTCQIRAVPCAHIYAGGKLRKATNLGPSKWDEFKADLDALRDELATGVLV